MRRALLSVALGVAASALLVSCNNAPANKQVTGLRVAYSSVGDPNPWFLAFSAELEKEAEKRGYNFRVTHAQARIEKQIADVEDIVAQKPDYLILGPIDREGSADALRIAKKAGIPVIVVNRDIKGVAGEDYVTKIYSDFEWIGEKMGEVVHDAFPADKKEIRVVELHGTPGAVRLPPPLLGQHTEELLADLGYAAGEIESLRGEKLVATDADVRRAREERSRRR